ncbi:hypothetical protein NPIL_86521 [Nephila pilipes]|uniref:Uncharacterized protein n=1 Tax=Nephila pilipes TaxID=299642 RepID=A0A8X6NR93_NEPPI|nr:hypothetical protein NPIL_86521 [Nephila pilipes]
MSSRDNFLRLSNISEIFLLNMFSRQSEQRSDFRPEGPELVKDLVPVIFEGHDKFIIPYSFLNRNCFEFVQHVILRYYRIISEIIIEGFWIPNGDEFTTFKFECVDEIEPLEEEIIEILEKIEYSFELCKFCHRDLQNTKNLFEFLCLPYINFYDELSDEKYYEYANARLKCLWTRDVKRLIESFKNIEITFRLSDMRLISIKNISHFNIFINSLYGFGNPKLKVCRLEELFTTCN